MRACVFILILLCLPSPAKAMEVFLGTVEKIDREEGRMTLRMIGGAEEASGEASADENESAQGSVTVEIAPERLPRHLQPGDTIRIWGDYMGRDAGVIRADTVRSGMRGGRRGDPTGVRGRLGRGRPGGRMGGRGPGRR